VQTTDFRHLILWVDKIGRQKLAENISRFFKTDTQFSSADKMDDDAAYGFIFIVFQKKTQKT